MLDTYTQGFVKLMQTSGKQSTLSYQNFTLYCYDTICFLQAQLQQEREIITIGYSRKGFKVQVSNKLLEGGLELGELSTTHLHASLQTVDRQAPATLQWVRDRSRSPQNALQLPS